MMTFSGQGDPIVREQRSRGAVPCDGLWGHPWSDVRSARAVPYRGAAPGHQLSLHGGLRRPGILLCGGHISSCRPEGWYCIVSTRVGDDEHFCIAQQFILLVVSVRFHWLTTG